MPKEKIMTLEEAMNAAREEISQLPRNKIKEFLPVIEELKENGKTWKELAEFFENRIGIPVKAFNIKNVYFEAHPEKQKQKQEKKKHKQHEAPKE